jgi:hypothetical protein
MMQQLVYLTRFKYVLQVIKNNILKLFDISVALVAMDTTLPVVVEITFVQTYNARKNRNVQMFIEYVTRLIKKVK